MSCATVRAAKEISRSEGADARIGPALREISFAACDERAVAFGAAAPEGGCIFGEVSADVLTVEIGGIIMDGGCLPAVGH